MMNNKYNFQATMVFYRLKRVIILLFLCITVGFAHAQTGTRYAFVNLDYIMKSIPEYAKAQQELDAYSLEMQNKYNADKVFLTATMREQREKTIAEKENKARLLQQEYFGTKGALFLKREELVKPLQDEVLEVIRDVAKDGNYEMIIDLSADNSVVYYDPKLDKSDVVLRKLGYSVKKTEE